MQSNSRWFGDRHRGYVRAGGTESHGGLASLAWRTLRTSPRGSWGFIDPTVYRSVRHEDVSASAAAAFVVAVFVRAEDVMIVVSQVDVFMLFNQLIDCMTIDLFAPFIEISGHMYVCMCAFISISL